MLDINLIRTDSEKVKRALLKRLDSVDLEPVLSLDRKRRELIVEAEHILSAEKIRVTVDLVVLATGMLASLEANKPAAQMGYDRDHFILPDQAAPGIFAAGCARGPVEVATAVQDATAAALKAMRAIHTAARR